jgi:hypothetical protein
MMDFNGNNSITYPTTPPPPTIPDHASQFAVMKLLQQL